MNQKQFLQFLTAQGLPEPVLVERESGELGEHWHTFEARALILDGSLTIHIEGISTEYFPGDEFFLFADQSHSESYGPQGVKYLVSRKTLTQ